MSSPSFWCGCARGKQNPAGDASEIEREKGDVRDDNIRPYTYSSSILHVYIRVIVVYVLPVSGLSLFQVLHAWYLARYMQKHATNYRVRGTGVCLGA